jgi:hypothetical protein
MHHDTNRAEASPRTPALPEVRGGPHLNALKHGLRAATLLLPGEDAEEFHALRQELFALHRPRTRTEARCVEAMVEHEWGMARCRRIRTRYQAKLLELVEGTGEAHCEKDPHRWHHSAMDCSLDERRIAKLLDWQLERLAVLQKLRRQQLIDRLIDRTGQEDALAPAEVRTACPTVRQQGDPLQRNPPRQTDGPATDSRDSESWKKRERTGDSGAAPAILASTASADGEGGKIAKQTPHLPPAGGSSAGGGGSGGKALEPRSAVA